MLGEAVNESVMAALRFVGVPVESYEPHTTCGIFRSIAVIVWVKKTVLVGIFSEYFRNAVL